MRKETWASGQRQLINTTNWWKHSRGKLLALRQLPGTESLLNINLKISDWSKEEEERNMRLFHVLKADEPRVMNMVFIFQTIFSPS